MVKCPGCRNQVAETFAQCPVCGTDLRAGQPSARQAGAASAGRDKPFARFALPAGSLGLIIVTLVRVATGPWPFGGHATHPIAAPPPADAVAEPAVPRTPPPPVPSPRPLPVTPPAAPLPVAPRLAQLNLRWNDGTAELQRTVGVMPEDQAAALGLTVLLSGADWYAARVRLTNTGDVPIRVFPENLRIHFNGETAGVAALDDPRFLRRTTVIPGESAEGLVVFRARVDIGAAIRLGGGEMSYAVQTIQVTHE